MEQRLYIHMYRMINDVQDDKSELMFTDDTAFIAHSHEDMQEIVTRFAGAAKAFGLQVNIKKTEMMFQPCPGTDDHHRCIQISGEDLVTVKEFKYLGSTATYNNKLDIELRLRKFKHLDVSKTESGSTKILQSRPNVCLFCHNVIDSTIRSRILDSVHGPSSQFEFLHDKAPEANPGC